MDRYAIFLGVIWRKSIEKIFKKIFKPPFFDAAIIATLLGIIVHILLRDITPKNEPWYTLLFSSILFVAVYTVLKKDGN